MTQFAYVILSAFSLCQIFTVHFIMARTDKRTRAGMGCLIAFLMGLALAFAALAKGLLDADQTELAHGPGPVLCVSIVPVYVHTIRPA